MFESITCTRCGGSGKYSFNQVDGDRCYGCAGTGKMLTKRGAAARAFLIASQMRPVTEIKVGEFLWDDTFGLKAKWLPITEIRPDTLNGGFWIATRRSSLGASGTSNVRSVRDEAHRQELVAAAMAYQETLTKIGKPSKKVAVAA